MAHDGQRGLDEDFEKLFERYYRPVSYYFANRGFSSDDCRDLAQETFLRAYRRWEHYRREKEQDSSWIFTIAANLYRNTMRDQHAQKRNVKKRSLSELLEQGLQPVDEDADPAAFANWNQQRRLVAQGVRTLPPRMRQCFLLRYLQGRSYKEIAEIMKVSIQSVRSQLHLAKKRLKQMISEC